MKTVNHECYVSLEVAKLLKDAGFDWDVNSYYNHILYIPNEWVWEVQTRKPTGDLEGCPRPTLEVAQRWLREVKNIHINVDTFPANSWRWLAWTINPERRIAGSEHKDSETYESALEAGIKKALELILEKGE